MSTHSTGASRSTLASIRSASRWRYSARPAAPRAAQAGNAAVAAATARSASRCPPRAISPSGCSSIGETSVNVLALATRSPPMKWSGETSTPATVMRSLIPSSRSQRPDVDDRVPAVDGDHGAVHVGRVVREEPGDRPRDLLGRARPPQRHVLGHDRIGSLARGSPSASISPSAIGVRTQPGQTQFARTPSGPWSSAMHWVSIASAAFDEQ